ncbi:hypothetical protein C2L65_25155 [Paraburkholderia terrae]|uniref:Uncharacterized protein n=2 Tax=Paraburkholderia terrae TaxID=311230 RepID=A0A2I8ETE1_9BURK|nr:hypothetical protein C2L65_25155 [Paraburkholderia terrae]
MPDLKRIHETANAIIGLLESEALKRVEVSADSEAARMSACLTMSIFEQFHAAMALVEAGLASHAAGPIRSMLDGLGDLMNLAKDQSYLDSMKLDTACENGGLFREFMKSPSIDESMREELTRWVDHDKPIIDELTGRKVKRYDMRQKLRNVGVEPIYVSYKLLCAHVHPNVTTLGSRHGNHSDQLVYRGPLPRDAEIMLHTLAVDYLVRCVSEIPKFSKGITVEEIDALTNKAVGMWREVVPAPEGE